MLEKSANVSLKCPSIPSIIEFWHSILVEIVSSRVDRSEIDEFSPSRIDNTSLRDCAILLSGSSIVTPDMELSDSKYGFMRSNSASMSLSVRVDMVLGVMVGPDVDNGE